MPEYKLTINILLIIVNFTSFRSTYIRNKGGIEITSSFEGPDDLVSLDEPARSGEVILDVEAGSGACLMFNISNKGDAIVTMVKCDLLKYLKLFRVDKPGTVKILPGNQILIDFEEIIDSLYTVSSRAHYYSYFWFNVGIRQYYIIRVK